MLEVLVIILIIIFSPVILIAGIISLFIVFALMYSIICIPIELVKQVKKCQKQGDQENIQK